MKMLLTRSEVIFSAVNIIIYFLRIIGLAPFSIRREKPIRNTSRSTFNWVIEFSKLGQCYNFLISILLPILSAFESERISSMNFWNESELVTTIGRIQSFLTASAVFIVLISWTVKQKKATSIINRLVHVDTQLSCMEIKPSYRKLLIFFYVHAVVIGFLFFAIWGLMGTFYNIKEVLNLIVLSLPSCIICWYIIEYSMIVGLVTTELESVNKNLWNMKTVWSHSSSNFLVNTYLDAFSLPDNKQLAIFQSLRSIRTTLYEICKDIDDFFSFAMLPSLATFFFIFICDVYYLITFVVTYSGALPLSFYPTSLIWVVICVYPITLLLSHVTKIMREAKLTAQIIHKLLTASMKQKFETKLQQFSLQLLHENFSFTACGFFTLDFTLMHAMLGSAATYIVILIQFQKLRF